MSYHPHSQLLAAYANGTIDAVHGLALATHIDMCPECHEQILSMEEENAQSAFEQASADEDDPLWQSMLEEILLSEPLSPAQKSFCQERWIEVDGKQFPVPRIIGRFIPQPCQWRSYGGKIYSLPLEVGDNARLSLLYICANVHLPQHTHRGQESTLVLYGGYSDEDGSYKAGDFIQCDGSVRHSPKTPEVEGCLCLTVLTEPLKFTQGVERIFNLFGKSLSP